MSTGGANLTSNFSDLVLVANAGNSSYVVSSGSSPALYVDNNGHVGLNTVTPSTQLEINSETGSCMTLRYNKSNTAFATIALSATGDLAINTNATGSKLSIGKSLDVVNHNGSTVGLKLGGALVRASAAELNYLAGITPGQVLASKALVLDASKNITGLTALSAERLTGTLQTAHQPNITKLGTLEELTISGVFAADTLAGTLTTGAQPNITSIGTLSSLQVAGALSADTLSGTLLTAAQPNITSLGSLSSLTIGGVTIGSEIAALSEVSAGTASPSKALVVDSNKSITGITSLSAASLTGVLQTAAQPNITSVGTLSTLTVSGGVSANQLSGTLLTAAQPNITSIGALTTLKVAGITLGPELGYLYNVVPGTAASSKLVILDANKNITGINSLTATSITGTLATAAQPNITSIGPLTSISIGGSVIGVEAGYLSGASPGNAIALKALVLSSNGTLSGLSSLSATNITGTLQTPLQPNITSVGTLSSLVVSGSTTLTSTVNASNSTSGSLRVAGGVGIAKNLYVGGTLDASAITINGIDITTMIGTGSGGSGGSGVSDVPSYVLSITGGSAAANKALVLNSSKGITGITSLNTAALTVTGAATLSSLTVNGVAITGGASGIPESITGVTPGTAAMNKALILDGSKSISGIGSIGASSGAFDTLDVSGVGNFGSLLINGVDVGDLAGGTIVSGYVSLKETQGAKFGATWTQVGTTTDVRYELAYSPELSIIVCCGENVMQYSYNGITWVTVAFTGTWTRCIWVSQLSKFIAVGTSNKICTSVDGKQWNLITVPINFIYAVCYSPSLQRLVAQGQSTIYSDNGGDSWDLHSQVDNRYSFGIDWSPALNKFVSILSVNSVDCIKYSDNGKDWTNCTPLANATMPYTVKWVADKSMFIVGATNYILYSYNGIDWTPISLTGSWYVLTWTSELSTFVAIGVGGAVRYGSSITALTNTSTISTAYIGTTAQITATWIPDLLRLIVASRSTLAYIVYSDPLFTAKINSQVESTSSTTGALVVSGGVGIGKTLSVGGSTVDVIKLTNTSTTGKTNVLFTNDVGTSWSWGMRGSADATQPGYFVIREESATADRMTIKPGGFIGIGVANPTFNLDVGGTFRCSGAASIGGAATISATTASTTTGSGALVCNGGVGIAGTLNVGGTIYCRNSTTSSSATTGSLVVTGGMGIAKSLYVGGVIKTINTTASTSTITGAVMVAGGVGITGVVSAAGLRIGASDVTSYLTGLSSDGTVLASKAIIADSNRSLNGLNTLNVTNIKGSTAIGFDWIERTPPSEFRTAYWQQVCWSPELSLFVASATNKGIATSKNGIDWSVPTIPIVNRQWLAMCWSSTLLKFVAVSYAGNGNCVMTSPDGEVWTEQATSNISAVSWISVCWSAEKNLFVAVAINGSIGRVATSVDGIAWILQTSPTALASSLLCVTWAKELNLFVATTQTAGSNVLTSPDGVTWTPRPSAPSQGWTSVCWSPSLGMLVAVASTGTYRSMWSIDGANWQLGSLAIANTWQDVCWAPEIGKFIAVSFSGTAGTRVGISTNGKDWATVASASDAGGWFAVCWAPSLQMLVAVSGTGSTGQIMTSSITNDLTISSLTTTLPSTTASTSSTTGALVVSGGVGIAGNLNVGGLVNNVNITALQTQATALETSIADLTARVTALGG